MLWDRCFCYFLAPFLGSRSELLVAKVGFVARVGDLACFGGGIVAEPANVSALGCRCWFDIELGWFGYSGCKKLGWGRVVGK